MGDIERDMGKGGRYKSRGRGDKRKKKEGTKERGIKIDIETE